ncbi:hypothetical protein PQU94_00975 [Asticcacaulis sp. DXS10W]|uniref:Uncharacterized protein n=1 Tax=Asticcacaulis currens TaxID=2984210 RepID=A0ABT5IAC4_9CAUL|nr:hypothetical protein [Asticcacaulis currens]MDC7692845.1 hypothetical protein [Asticcacaulis currens]
MKRAEIVRTGAARLIQAEGAIETAICDVADLISYLGRTRMEEKIALEIGDEAMTSLVATMAALSEARSSILCAHGQLNAVKGQLGYSTVAVGTGEDKFTTKPKGLLVVENTRESA